MQFAHTADDSVIRTGLLQTGTCNLALAPLPEAEQATSTEPPAPAPAA